ncbi:MAG: glycosyltransferase family 2 protein [Kiritimatiellia bacterium]|nr:glycosyltransferase family 2 protein [Kiritimatiellia bacterium]
MISDTGPGSVLDGVSVVIPAYNEGKALGPVIEQLRSVLPNMQAEEWEIIVVDDGSLDDTREVAEKHDSVTVLRHDVNRGYGAALKTGIRQAKYDLICITDADGTYPNERIPDLVGRASNGQFDMVVGARTGDNVNIPLIRRPAKWAIGRLANYVAATTIPDLNSGLRVFRRDTCLRFFGLLPDGFSFTTTITLAMLQSGYRLDFVPIDYHKRVGKSKIRPVRDVLNFTQLVLRIALYFAPLKIFLPFSGLLVLLAVAWALFTHIRMGKLADVSTLVIASTGLQIAVIGMLAELINRRLPNLYEDRPSANRER